MYLSMCVLMARCGGLEVISLCACARVCLRPAALERPQQLYRGLPCRKNEANWSENYYTKRERKHARINASSSSSSSSSSTPSFVHRRRTLPSHVTTRTRGEGKGEERHIYPLPRLVAGAELEELVTKERAFSLCVERCLCPRTRRPDESRGRSPSSPRSDCSLVRRF